MEYSDGMTTRMKEEVLVMVTGGMRIRINEFPPAHLQQAERERGGKGNSPVIEAGIDV